MSLLIIHEILALGLLYSCFCRAVRTDKSTHRDVLAAFWLLSIASVVNVFAPIVWPEWRPTAASSLLLLAVLGVQGVTSRYWRNGAPPQFTKDQHR